MPFDVNQPSFLRFRNILKERTCPVLVFSGAGLSQPAGLPSWKALGDALTVQGKNIASHLTGSEKLRHEGLLQAAENAANLWETFSLLKKALGETSFVSGIRDQLGNADSKNPPAIYTSLWKLGIRGFLNLNLDRFATRSLSTVQNAAAPIEFSGRRAKYAADVIRGGRPFVANLHGTIETDSSWVFTSDDFKELMSSQGYTLFLQTCFLSCTVIFIGVTADDQAAGGHLERLRQNQINFSGHYWLTNRNETGLADWADRAGIHQIFYDAPGGNHQEILDALEHLRKFVPQEEPVSPVVPNSSKVSLQKLPPPAEVEKLPANEIRLILNKEAVQILNSNLPTKVKDYEKFCVEYEEAIYRAWSASPIEGKNDFFDYKLLNSLARGAFGQVYRASRKDGKIFAIKILHGTVRDISEMLQGFRRGVRAMQILSQRGIMGMVPYHDQWEIPAATVMDFIDGPNLETAVESGFLDQWDQMLYIMWQVVSIISRAHSVPERVLHRDIRPANIMLQQGPNSSGEYDEVVVLDFDLAWHKDASEVSINLAQSANGYLAPEQTERLGKTSTRNALVDSFGIGMTLYFVISKKHPQFGLHRHADWRDVLKREIASKPCSQWKSLPRRLARLVEWSTKQEQSLRWDVSRIKGEIARLRDCLHSKNGIKSCELLAEEIAARCADMSGYYSWNKDNSSATLELRSGFTVTVTADEPTQFVRLLIEWSNAGDKQYENVKKYVGTAADKCCSALKGGGWSIEAGGKHVTFESCRISAKTPVSSLSKISDLTKVASALSPAIQALRLS